MNLNIYTYTSALSYLLDYHKQFKLTSEASLRSWSKMMGFTSPVLILDILKKKRPIKLKYVKYLAKGMHLNPAETAYLGTLVLFESSSEEEKEHYENVLESLRPKKMEIDPEADVFAHWLNSVIYVLGQREDRDLTPDLIQLSLKRAVSREDIEKSIQCLSHHQLIQKNGDGSFKSCGPEFLTTKNDLPISSSHRYYSQVQENAQAAIELPLDQREFQCFNIAMNEESILKVKEVIRNARKEVAAHSDSQGRLVYQFNFNAFPVAGDVFVGGHSRVDEETRAPSPVV